MKCLIIAGAPEYDIDLIKEQSENNDLIICADKGYSYAKSAGVKPDIVIGDFDSFTGTVSGDFEILRYNTDKDYTDTHICVDKALEKGCKEITIISAIGGRLDHTLGNLCLLGYIAGCESVVLSIKGAKYCVDDFDMKCCPPMGVSNIFDSDKCAIDIKSGRALVIINLNNEFL